MSQSDQAPAQSGPPKKARVARIITPQQIALNVGSVHGVTVGLRYRIVHEVDIPDPENLGEQLASLVYGKAVVEVTQVFDRVCIAKPPGGFFALDPNKAFYQPRTLKVAQGDAALSDSDMVVRVGDEARLEEPKETQ